MIPDPIQKELLELLELVNEQIKIIEVEAAERGFQGQEMRNTDGSYTIIPLLVSKGQILATLAQLRKPTTPFVNRSARGGNW